MVLTSPLQYHQTHTILTPTPFNHLSLFLFLFSSSPLFLITFLNPQSFFLFFCFSQSPRLLRASHSFHSLLDLYSFLCIDHFLHSSVPPIWTTVACSLRETPHHASPYYWPTGLSTRAFALRSQPRPLGLHSGSREYSNSCPHKTGHRWPCTPHVRTSRPYYRPR